MEESPKPRDLEERTFRFAESVRGFVKQLPRTISNAEDVRQLVRASGSVFSDRSSRKLWQAERLPYTLFCAEKIISKSE